MRILIRCAVLETDCEYDVDDQLSIRQLKEHLSIHHPGAPISGTQRIIYMGRILSDDERLQQVVNKYGENSVSPHVMHLMYTPSELRQRKKPATSPRRAVPRPAPTATPTMMPANCELMSAAYKQYVQQYQQAWLKQYTAYFQSMGQPIYQQATVLNQAQQQAAHQLVEEPPAAADNEPDAGAVGGAQIDDELMARDILDHVYMALRGSILLFLLYYYSSTYRVLAVGCLAFIFWFMQRNRPELANEAVINAVNLQDAQQSESDDNNNETTPASDENASALQVFFRTSHAFIGGFFLSLLPDGNHFLEQQAGGDAGNANRNQQLPVI